ncbi:uncharacterized protein BXIN_0866 [Babesia sp. Xinjiang]|uniref:uncharacterized protein n=1 Tax=Babesia sp. Xinjiang TaxID=462227 RepID=UPI000A24D6F0|nr:uncharacterized protein BXIN_0866 [Babesia sp. Xinjiang]ORM41237.1 hypothetical protein BXIN_0866 [Babesia sp. Xinjiang]
MEVSRRQGVDDLDAANLFEIDRVDFVGTDTSSTLLKALDDLRKIVENILLNPWEHKTRRIREANPVYAQHIATNPHLLAVLEAIGFRSVNGFAVLQIVHVPQLREAYRSIIEALRDEYGIKIKSLEGHFFDPFKAYKHSSDIKKNADAESFECQGSDLTREQIEKLRMKLSETLTTSLRQWTPQIYLENVKKTPETANATTNDDTSEQKHSTSHIMKIYNVGKCGDFESASRKQLEALKNQCAHLEAKQTVELKIRLPANTVLTIHPPMKTLVGTVKHEIQSILIERVKLDDWELVEMPIRRVLNENKTLIQQDISHKVVLQFRYKSQLRSDIRYIFAALRTTDEQIVTDEALKDYLATPMPC